MSKGNELTEKDFIVENGIAFVNLDRYKKLEAENKELKDRLEAIRLLNELRKKVKNNGQ